MNKKATEIMGTLEQNGYEAYIIGGFVRDYFMGKNPKDIDIFTDCGELKEIFPDGNIIGNEERQEKILTIVVDGIEVSQYRGNGKRTEVGTSLKEHINTCDFTCNAVAMDKDMKVVDLVDGMDDIEDRRLRAVGNPRKRFDEDLLRILRGIRMMSKGFKEKRRETEIHRSTTEVMKEVMPLLKELPIERIREEFLKIINESTGDDAIELLYNFGFFKEFIPEFVELTEVKGGKHHNENVGQHSVLTFCHMSNQTDNALLKFTALLHDIGKREYQTSDEENTFYKHEKYGSDFLRELMTEWKFSNDDIDFVSTIVKKHCIGDVDEMKNKTVIKLITDLEDNGVSVYDYVLHKWADHQGNLTNPRVKYGDFVRNYPLLKKYREILEKKLPKKIRDLEVNGDDVKKHGIRGKQIGDYLKRMFNEVNEGKLPNDRWEQLELLKQWIIEE